VKEITGVCVHSIHFNLFLFSQMSKVVGIELGPTMESSLSDMIDNGLLQHVAKLEEIAVAANKEYALEQNLHRMKQEWDDVEFELVPYR
jgi:dynein heavy chain